MSPGSRAKPGSFSSAIFTSRSKTSGAPGVSGTGRANRDHQVTRGGERVCGCLDKSARQAFPNPTQLWKFIRTKNRESLSASEKKAGRQMFDACARFIDPEK